MPLIARLNAKLIGVQLTSGPPPMPVSWSTGFVSVGLVRSVTCPPNEVGGFCGVKVKHTSAPASGWIVTGIGAGLGGTASSIAEAAKASPAVAKLPRPVTVTGTLEMFVAVVQATSDLGGDDVPKSMYSE